MTINQTTSQKNEIVENEELECATKEMFSNETAKLLEPLTTKESENMTDFSSDYLGFLSFKGNKGDKILTYLSGVSIGNYGEMFVVNKLVDEGSRYWRTSSYNFLPVKCISAIPPHMAELNNKIKLIKIKNNPIIIYEKPGCCTGYNADVHYYIELPSQFQEKTKNKYIEITPWFYDLDEFEKVIRSLKLEDVKNLEN